MTSSVVLGPVVGSRGYFLQFEPSFHIVRTVVQPVEDLLQTDSTSNRTTTQDYVRVVTSCHITSYDQSCNWCRLDVTDRATGSDWLRLIVRLLVRLEIQGTQSRDFSCRRLSDEVKRAPMHTPADRSWAGQLTTIPTTCHGIARRALLSCATSHAIRSTRTISLASSKLSGGGQFTPHCGLSQI